jgi:hypothetical protein
VLSVPGDWAWLSLARKDNTAARPHLTELVAVLDDTERRWY